MTNSNQLSTNRLTFRRELFLFFVLLGLLPAIHGLTFFHWLGFSEQVGFGNVRFTGFSNIPQNFIYITYLLGLAILLNCIILKKWRLIIGLLPFLLGNLLALYAHFGMQYVETETHKKLFEYFNWFYFYGCQISFLYFIVKGKIRSYAYLIFTAMLLYFTSFLATILFLCYTLFFRLIFYAIYHNLYLFKQMGFGGTLKMMFRSFLYWWPMLIFILPGVFLSNWLYKKTIDGIYEYTFIECSDETKKYELKQFESDLFRANRDLTTKSYQAVGKAGADLEKQAKRSKKLPKDAAKKFGAAIPKTLPEISESFKLADCGFFSIGCKIKNGVKRDLDKTYQQQRKEALAELEKEAAELGKKGSKKAVEGVQEIREMASDLVKVTSETTENTILFSFLSFHFYSLIMDLIFAFIVIKSFMYVFARVAFTDDTDNYVTFMDHAGGMPHGTLVTTGNQYNITENATEDFYISRTFEPAGRAPKFALPQWSKGIFSRLLTRNYTMNHVVMKDRKEPVHFRAVGSTEFVEWNLKEGEVVIFKYANFVGMTENVQLSRIVSLRLTSLLMGQFIFSTAKGPGKLILLTQGKSTLPTDEKSKASVATSRILAWDKNARFHVESELSIMDVFMSSIYLKKKADDVVLIDADVRGPAKSGIVQFIRHFILPV